jgi:rhomboid protease GluP
MAMLTPLKGDAVDAPAAHVPGWLVPSRASYGLQTLVGINVLVYLAMMMSGSGVLTFGSEDLIAWGANYGPELQGPGYLRLITSTFVHGGVMHLLNNMYGLVIAGTFLGTLMPNWRLIACYLIAGLGGSITGAVLHPSTISVGASGAILGLWGVLIALALSGDARVIKLGRKALLINGLIFAGLTIFLGSLTPGIDNAAHAGGLTTGFLLGAAIWLRDRAHTIAVQES